MLPETLQGSQRAASNRILQESKPHFLRRSQASRQTPEVARGGLRSRSLPGCLQLSVATALTQLLHTHNYWPIITQRLLRNRERQSGYLGGVSHWRFLDSEGDSAPKAALRSRISLSVPIEGFLGPAKLSQRRRRRIAFGKSHWSTRGENFQVSLVGVNRLRLSPVSRKTVNQSGHSDEIFASHYVVMIRILPLLFPELPTPETLLPLKSSNYG